MGDYGRSKSIERHAKIPMPALRERAVGLGLTLAIESRWAVFPAAADGMPKGQLVITGICGGLDYQHYRSCASHWLHEKALV